MRWLLAEAASQIARSGARLLHCPAFVSPWRSPVPFVLTVHDNTVTRHPDDHPLEWRLYATRVLPGRARRAAEVIVPSEFVQADVIEAWRLSEERVVVIPPGVDAQFTTDDQIQRGEELSLLFAGAPIRRKNLDLVLRAMATSRRGSALSQAQLLVTGARCGEFADHVRTATRLGVAARVRWLGIVPESEMPALYRRAHVLVYPSLDEGFGLPPLEAMASGTPVVAGRAGALPETVGDAAVLVDPDDPEDAAVAIEALLTDVPLRRRLLAAGRARVAEFTWSRCADATAAAYRRALEG
jgi:glycosyltransferase involved in cell wall biosynthesis